MTALTRNPNNTNFLQGSKFQVLFPRISTVSYFCKSVNIPGVSYTPPEQATPFKNIPRPGDKLLFGNFQMEFIVDEELLNYQIIQDWIRGITFPCNFDEYKNLNRESIISLNSKTPQYADASVTVLSALNNAKLSIEFKNLFPLSLSDIMLSTELSSENIITAKAEFAYHIYSIKRF